MPFDPRQKNRSTTSLPATLREELGISAPSASKSHFRPGHNLKADKRQQYNARKGNTQPYQLKVIGRPQSAVNGAPPGTKQGPIKSLRNQEKDSQASSSSRSAVASSPSQPKKRKYPSQDPPSHHEEASKSVQSSATSSTSSKKDKKKRDKSTNYRPEQPDAKMRVNPFTGEMEAAKSKKPASSVAKSTALERMMQKAQKSDAGGTVKKRRKDMSQQEKEEEDEIRWLEYHLRKGQTNENVEETVKDDLDDFLQDLDRFQVGMYEDGDADSSDSNSGSSSADSASESELDTDDSSDDSDASEASQSQIESSEVDFDDEEMQFDSNDEDDFSNWDAAMATTDEDGDSSEQEYSSSSDDMDSEAEEAITLLDGSGYSAPVSEARSEPTSASTATTLPGKYIPPALRAKMAAASAAAATSESATGVVDDLASQKLRRQAQGLLNKLGDGNIDSIVNEVEALYRSHPRAHVTSIITQLILDTVTSRSNLVDTFVILHGAFVAALHKVIGVEFAAYFVQRSVEELLRQYQSLSITAEVEDDTRGKECLNLTVLICELYNLQVIACPLVYDLIRLFLGQAPGAASTSDAKAVGETDVELILKTIRSCGPQLRHDDPSALRAIISLTSSRLSSTSIRSKFMLERMEDLLKASTSSRSSSKSSSGAASNDVNDPSSPAGQLLARMKKYLGGMAKKRTVKSYEPLRIGLKDLQDADKKGKWWLVGAAWTGQNDQDEAQGLTKLTPMNSKAPAMTHNAADETALQEQNELLALARSQGMNTDARRAVFITLVTSEDYRQATETLLQLKLNEVQHREVVRVLVHCAGSEAVFNPYYTLIGQEICKHNHGMRVTLQYCLWDFLRELGAKEVGGEKFAASMLDENPEDEAGKSIDPRRISNLARCFGWWLTHDCLSLQALKVVDFTTLHPRPTHFLGLMFVYSVLSIQSFKSPVRVLDLTTLSRHAVQLESIKKFAHSGLVGGNTDLARGVLFFLNTHLTPRYQRKLVLGQDKSLKTQAQPLLLIVQDAIAALVEHVQSIVQLNDKATASDDPLSDLADSDTNSV